MWLNSCQYLPSMRLARQIAFNCYFALCRRWSLTGNSCQTCHEQPSSTVHEQKVYMAEMVAAPNCATLCKQSTRRKVRKGTLGCVIRRDLGLF